MSAAYVDQRLDFNAFTDPAAAGHSDATPPWVMLAVVGVIMLVAVVAARR